MLRPRRKCGRVGRSRIAVVGFNIQNSWLSMVGNGGVFVAGQMTAGVADGDGCD